MRRYTGAELAPSITRPSFVTDNETDIAEGRPPGVGLAIRS
jgi:hypothetical protein